MLIHTCIIRTKQVETMTDTPAHTQIDWPEHANAVLLLEDGSTFFGNGFGKEALLHGEICFNTSMTGYQEILTDPSYCQQIVVFTFPHIGNIGTNQMDFESAKGFASGMVCAEMPTEPSNWRSEVNLSDWLASQGRTGICQIDTRALTQHIRDNGAQNAVIYFSHTEKTPITELQESFKDAPNMEGQDLAKTVSCTEPYTWDEGEWSLMDNVYKITGNDTEEPHIVVIDYGVKRNILRELAARGAKITVVPCTTSFKEIEAFAPDGILLSNGPGDPAATAEYAVPVIQEILESDIPVFGICLGHQLLSIALGAKTHKMPFGHRGGNHPVKNLKNDTVEITSQNHGFCVIADSIPSTAKETHVSLFDGTNEGISMNDARVFSVQYHPEASPGPQDSTYLFDDFLEHVTWYHQQQHAA